MKCQLRIMFFCTLPLTGKNHGEFRRNHRLNRYLYALKAIRDFIRKYDETDCIDLDLNDFPFLLAYCKISWNDQRSSSLKCTRCFMMRSAVAEFQGPQDYSFCSPHVSEKVPGCPNVAVGDKLQRLTFKFLISCNGYDNWLLRIL